MKQQNTETRNGGEVSCSFIILGAAPRYLICHEYENLSSRQEHTLWSPIHRFADMVAILVFPPRASYNSH